MAEPVKRKRPYHSPQRAKQAGQTRAAILTAAQVCFIQNGWAGTTIAEIARKADVSKESVYAIFGSKRAILSELLARAVRGDTPDVPLLEQARPQAIRASRSQSEQIRLFAQDISTILSRAAPLVAVAREAAGEPGLGELYGELHTGRRRNLAFVVDALAANGPFRPGMDRERALATIWRLASPELFLLMRDVEGMSTEAYADWLAASLEILLLPE